AKANEGRTTRAGSDRSPPTAMGPEVRVPAARRPRGAARVRGPGVPVLCTGGADPMNASHLQGEAGVRRARSRAAVLVLLAVVVSGATAYGAWRVVSRYEQQIEEARREAE